MRAIQHAVHGGPEVLRAVSVPDPVAGRGEVLIEVGAAGVNRIDVLQRTGPGLLPGFSLPHIPGTDVAGRIVATGPGVTTRSPGDRVVVDPSLHCGSCTACQGGDSAFCAAMSVVGATRQGGYAELVAVPATHVHPIPDHIGFQEAAAIPTAYSMAWQALLVRGGLRRGETLLVHGAGSGITIAAVQIAKRLGVTVLVSGSSDEKLRRTAKLGADVLINHRSTDLAGAVRDATDGRGADIVLDHVGPALFQPSLDALRLHGRLVFCGNTTGARASFDLARAYQRGLSLIGAESYDHASFGEMLTWYWSSACEPVIDSIHDLGDAPDAHRRLENGENWGKILLTPRRIPRSGAGAGSSPGRPG